MVENVWIGPAENPSFHLTKFLAHMTEDRQESRPQRQNVSHSRQLCISVLVI